MNHDATLGLDFTSFFFFGAASESELSSSESVSELEELSEDELLSWPTGPLPFSSESLKHMRMENDLRHVNISLEDHLHGNICIKQKT